VEGCCPDGITQVQNFRTLMCTSVGLLISTSTDAVSPHSHSTGPAVELSSSFFSLANDVKINGPSCGRQGQHSPLRNNETLPCHAEPVHLAHVAA